MSGDAGQTGSNRPRRSPGEDAGPHPDTAPSGSAPGGRIRAVWTRAVAFFGGDWPRWIAGRVLGERRATMLFWIMDRYGQAGGGIIATGLALRALRTILLFVLFVVAVTGWVLTDLSAQQAVYDALVTIVPPLADLIGTSLESLAANRVPIGILGIAGLLWGISGFYETLDDAMSRIIPGQRRRDLIERRWRGVLTAILAIGALVSIAVINTGLGAVEALVYPLFGGVLGWHLVTLTGAALSVALVVLTVYRFVPTAPPTVRQALAPAVLAGVVIAALTGLYALVIPLLVRGFAVFGAVAALIGALLWLEYVFQAILFGGTWAAWRRDEARRAATPAAEGSAGS